ncbi:MAG: mechanosensitive ion channel family protein [Candidatus Micrarchaeota archaeon]
MAFGISEGTGYELMLACGIMLASFILAKLLYWFIKKYIQGLTKKTHNTLDDRLVEASETPIFLFVVAVGLYAAIGQFSLLLPFRQQLDRIFSVIWISLGAFSVMRIFNSFLNWYAEEIAPKTRTMANEIFPTIRRIMRVVVVLVALMMILDNFGVEISPLLASLGIAGLAVALAFQDTLSNFFAGIYITADRPIKTGDYIKLESGDEGKVAKIGWRSAQLLTLQNNVVVVPNSKLAQSIMTNFNAPDRQLSFSVQAFVSYDSNLEKVEKVALEEALRIQKTAQGAVRDFAPILRFHTFADSGIGFAVILGASEFGAQFPMKHLFIKSLHTRFKKERIEIPYPKRDVYIRR